jgi:hypothetical protein
VIAHLLALCLVLAAWPQGAALRAEGLSLTHLGARATTAALDLDERERGQPTAPALASGRADADEPEPTAASTARAEPVPVPGSTPGVPARPSHAPLRHRPCAAPPTGPPAA